MCYPGWLSTVPLIFKMKVGPSVKKPVLSWKLRILQIFNKQPIHCCQYNYHYFTLMAQLQLHSITLLSQSIVWNSYLYCLVNEPHILAFERLMSDNA